MGFNGIAAAFLGGLNPIGTIFSSFFIQHITNGGAYVDKTMYCAQISDLISAHHHLPVRLRAVLQVRHEQRHRPPGGKGRAKASAAARADKKGGEAVMILLIQYTLIFASVLILVALGGCFSEHSGVINLGLEGIMIMGALGGALTMRYAAEYCPGDRDDPRGHPRLARWSAWSIPACWPWPASTSRPTRRSSARRMNLLGTAGATVIVKAINTAANPDDVSSIIQYGSAKNALSGATSAAFEFNWFMLVALIALVAAYVTLYKTRFGLRLMACGEHPQAADSASASTSIRCAGRACSSPASSAASAASSSSPQASREWRFEYGVAGFGFLSLAVMIFGQWKPQRIALARAAVRLLPCARQRLHRLRLPQGDEPAELRVQYAAVHHLAGRAGLYVQEVPRAQGRGYPLRQGYALSCTRFLSPAGSYGLAGAFISSSGGFDFYANG